MRYINVFLQYLKGIIKWAFGNESLRRALFEISANKWIYGNDQFKDWVSNKEIVEMLDYMQDQLDRVEKLKPNSETEKTVKAINESKEGPLKNFVAKVHKNKHGCSNHGIDLGFRTEIGGRPVQFGIGFDGNASIKAGPLSIEL